VGNLGHKQFEALVGAYAGVLTLSFLNGSVKIAYCMAIKRSKQTIPIHLLQNSATSNKTLIKQKRPNKNEVL
jgi:hypothetical protein